MFATAARYEAEGLIWNIAEPPTCIGRLRRQKGDVGQVAWSPRGNIIATSGKRPVPANGWAEDEEITLWDAASWVEICTLAAGLRGVDGLAFSPDGTSLLTGDYSFSGICLRLWNVEERREDAHFGIHPFGVAGVSFSPDGRYVAARSFTFGEAFYPFRVDENPFYQRTIRIFEVSSGRELDLIQYFDPVLSISFSADARKLLVCGESCLLCDLFSGTREELFAGGTKFINDGATSPALDGLVAIGSGGKPYMAGSFEDCGVLLNVGLRSEGFIGR